MRHQGRVVVEQSGDNTAWCGLRGTDRGVVDYDRMVCNTGAVGVIVVVVDRNWWSNDQPSYVSAASDANYGRCLGW